MELVPNLIRLGNSFVKISGHPEPSAPPTPSPHHPPPSPKPHCATPPLSPISPTPGATTPLQAPPPKILERGLPGGGSGAAWRGRHSFFRILNKGVAEGPNWAFGPRLLEKMSGSGGGSGRFRIPTIWLDEQIPQGFSKKWAVQAAVQGGSGYMPLGRLYIFP